MASFVSPDTVGPFSVSGDELQMLRLTPPTFEMVFQAENESISYRLNISISQISYEKVETPSTTQYIFRLRSDDASFPETQVIFQKSAAWRVLKIVDTHRTVSFRITFEEFDTIASQLEELVAPAFAAGAGPQAGVSQIGGRRRRITRKRKHRNK